VNAVKFQSSTHWLAAWSQRPWPPTPTEGEIFQIFDDAEIAAAKAKQDQVPWVAGKLFGWWLGVWWWE